MNQFSVKFWEEGKPTGARGFQVGGCETFEEILLEFVLRDLCKRKYYHEYEWFMLNEHVFIERLHANSHLCEYKVQLFDMFDRDKHVGDFQVEIHTITYYYPKGEDYSQMLLKEEQEYKSKKPKKNKKEKKLTKWVQEESTAIRWFLIDLSHSGSLKKLKEKTSKATYYRNLKLCREKGYIVGDKLVRKVYY